MTSNNQEYTFLNDQIYEVEEYKNKNIKKRIFIYLSKCTATLVQSFF